MISKQDYKYFTELLTNLKALDGKPIKELLRGLGFGHIFCSAARLSEYGIEGSAFRSWVSGLFANGVYLCTRNHEPAIYCTESPDITLTPGCQDSRLDGDPMPEPSRGGLMTLYVMPDAALPRITITVDKLVKEVIRVIEKELERVRIEIEREQEEQSLHAERIIQDWASDST